MPSDHYDMIVIGSGPGGATLASRLASTGKRILILERGDYLKREPENWDTKAVFLDGRYAAKEIWHDKSSAAFSPNMHYCVGGNSKVYGSALVRMRREDFGELRHSTGTSPAWPVSYDVFDPYYLEAEALYHVHGQRGEDPNEPNAIVPFPFPRIEHEGRIAELSNAWARQGLKPFHLPLGILLDQKPGTGQPTHDSACIRCAAFDGFPCLTNGKADAQIICVDPMLKAHDNVTLLTGACVTRLETDAAGRVVTDVHVLRDGEAERFSADLVVLAAGALNSAILLIKSASSAHPNGLANSSDQVGRNYMRHNLSAMMAVSRRRNDTIFQKTLALTDFYFGTKDWPYPMGFIQMCGKIQGQQIRGEAVPQWAGFIPDAPFNAMAARTIDFWLSSEDLPDPENRVTIAHDGTVNLAVVDNNLIAHQKLQAELRRIMEAVETAGLSFERSIFLTKNIGIDGVSHQAGTLRFGTDLKRSVLDVNCKAHDLDNLYVTGRKLLSFGWSDQSDVDDHRQRLARR